MINCGNCKYNRRDWTNPNNPDFYCGNETRASASPIARHVGRRLIGKDGISMSDLISRQWLMECVNEGWIKFDTEKDENRFIHLVRDIAPSARPGRWIPQDHNKRNGYVTTTVYYYPKCSECGHSGNYGMNYCPHCGAKMTEDESCK